ncbi:MAG: hypothetical protein ACJAVR_003070 [Paracoccaceae bacterium]
MGAGFQLARPAKAIVVGDVVPLTQTVLNVVECFAPNPNSCPLIGVYQLSRAFVAALRPGTSQTAAPRKPPLRRIRRFAPPTRPRYDPMTGHTRRSPGEIHAQTSL